MGKVITAYPTAGITNREPQNIFVALYKYFNSIEPITNFFEISKSTSVGYDGNYIRFKKGAATMGLTCKSSDSDLFFYNNSQSNCSAVTSFAVNIDIPISYATGINGTTVVWLDNYNKGACMLFSDLSEKAFFTNSAEDNLYSFYYSDTGGAVSNLPAIFNGSNIGKGGEYIAQPYYHLGINTGDIYTFDGGTDTIPWGEFSINNAEFVRIYSNFALRLK